MTRCENCGGPMAFLLRTRDYNAGGSPELFEYRRCSGCRFVQIAAIPERLEEFYADDYGPYRAPSVDELPSRAARERFKLELIPHSRRGGRLLEIGPSWGAFAYLARQAGYSVDTIEMDERCCQFLESTVGVRVHRGPDVVAALRQVPPADVIVLWHVIEHLAAPFTVLDALAAHLRPGGVMAISTPNPEALQFAVFRARWVHLDAPRHLQLIPSAVLRQRLERAGLTRTHHTLDDPAGRVLNRMGWQSSILNAVAGRDARLPARIAARLVTEGLVRMDRLSGRGAAYTSIFSRTHTDDAE